MPKIGSHFYNELRTKYGPTRIVLENVEANEDLVNAQQFVEALNEIDKRREREDLSIAATK